MFVSLLQRLQPTQQPADRVIVYDDLGNAIMVAVQVGAGVIKCASIRDPDFSAMLREVGILQIPKIEPFQVKH